MKPRWPWIVTHEAGLRLECQRCGETYAPRLPMPMGAWVALARAWMRPHMRCAARMGVTISGDMAQRIAQASAGVVLPERHEPSADDDDCDW